MNKKIDLYFLGDYMCTTQQSKTCREARLKFLESCKRLDHSLLNRVILKYPKELKARFAK